MKCLLTERVVNHSDTLNRMRYTQAPGGPTGQGRQRPLEEYYKEDSSEGEDEMYESEKPRPGIETMIPQDGEQVSVSRSLITDWRTALLTSFFFDEIL